MSLTSVRRRFSLLAGPRLHSRTAHRVPRCRELRALAGILIGIAGFGVSIAAQQITDRDLIDASKTPERWLTYGGDYSGRRHSPLTQITPANVHQLTAQWTFQTDVLGKFEATPVILAEIPRDAARVWCRSARAARHRAIGGAPAHANASAGNPADREVSLDR